jgi:hypothetical protein
MTDTMIKIKDLRDLREVSSVKLAADFADAPVYEAKKNPKYLIAPGFVVPTPVFGVR